MWRFKEICETHGRAAYVDEMTRNRIYYTRSELLRGRYLFQLDEAPWAWGFAPAEMAEYETYSVAGRLAKTVLRSWLLAQ
jgi:hypothetical protein